MFDPVIFREYDIRGIFEKQFDLNFVTLLGKAYGTFLQRSPSIKTKTITIGRDARISGPAIVESLTQGVRSTGINVIQLGLITSPISYFSTFEMAVDGAIMVTGSHNPPDYNGFKLSVGKSTIFGADILELLKIIQSGNFSTGAGGESQHNIFPQYLARYKKEFNNIKNVPVVLDCGNGAAGCIVSDLYKTVGLNPLVLFEKPDGKFPNHHPDPTVEKNLVDLKKAVLETKSVAGIGFDGDADRIGVVDHTGKMIYGDELMTLFARAILKDQPKGKIIGDVKCSDRMYHDVSNHGGDPIMWKTGHSLIKEKIKVEKSPFGGEMSGHIFFADRNYGYDDALYAGLRLCEILSNTGKTIPELLSGLPPAFNTPEIRIDTTEEKKVLIVEALKKNFSKPSDDYKVNLLDGLRVSYRDGWALARSSNTQPVLVLRFESSTEAGLERIKKQFHSVVDPLL